MRKIESIAENDFRGSSAVEVNLGFAPPDYARA
jgi:hypothetical protein